MEICKSSYAAIAAGRRYKGERRILDVLQILIRLPGATAKDVHREFVEDVGVQVHLRTIKRDLDLLVMTCFARRSDRFDGGRWGVGKVKSYTATVSIEFEE